MVAVRGVFSSGPVASEEDMVHTKPKDIADSLLSRKLPPCGGTFSRPFHIAYDEDIRLQEFRLLQQMFHKADRHHDGEITLAEFTRSLQDPAIWDIFSQRFGLQRHEITRLFRAFDRDCSGTIDFQEWLFTCQWLMEVVKNGDAITNWRVRELKERFPKYRRGPDPVDPARAVCQRPTKALGTPRLPTPRLLQPTAFRNPIFATMRSQSPALASAGKAERDRSESSVQKKGSLPPPNEATTPRPTVPQSARSLSTRSGGRPMPLRHLSP